MNYLCSDCPRLCHAIRNDSEGSGLCRCGINPRIVRAAPHYGEEPCISGTKGSGAVFFSGCNLRCVFCQNHTISRTPSGKIMTKNEFTDMLYRLEDTGVHNINLVTPTHHIRFIADALSSASLSIPVVWNSSGYESVEQIRLLEGLVSVYLPDLKYMDRELAGRFSRAPDYPQIATEAIREMFRQTGPVQLDQDGLLLRGVLIRHLILPGAMENSKSVIDWVSSEFSASDILFSLMSQYTPMSEEFTGEYKNLSRRVRQRENRLLINYMKDCGILNGYCQETASSTEEMIPDFDGTGVSAT